VGGNSLVCGSTDTDGLVGISLVDFVRTSPVLFSSFSSVKSPPSDELSFVEPFADRFIGRLTFVRRGRSLPK
jgi:hypothetical protein